MKKRIAYLQKKDGLLDEDPLSGDGGSLFEHLGGILKIVNQVVSTKPDSLSAKVATIHNKGKVIKKNKNFKP